MPEPKAQLVDPQGPIDVPGINATGIITATGGFVGAVQGAATGLANTTTNLTVGVVTSTGYVGDVTGTASSVTKGANLSLGIVTATSFTGDVFGNAAGLSTTTAGLKLGIVTSTTFAGNFTGMGSGITGTPHIQAGVMTATSFAGNFTGLASGITGTPNIMVGVLTGTSFSGDGSNLTGIAATNWIVNNVTANSSSTAIDLALGNVVKFTQSASTTVSFANTGTSNIVTFIRTKDDTSTERTITWPSSVKWNGGSPPVLVNNAVGNDAQQFQLLTRDEGVTWYGWETISLLGGNYRFLWGDNEQGRYGNSTVAIQFSSPVQVGVAEWNKIYGTGSVADAWGGQAWYAKAPGTLWVWGTNKFGELGQNNTTNYSSPVQVPGTTWAQVSSYSKGPSDPSGVAAVKTDGTLWTWGGNEYGRTGQNSTAVANYSSPVQVGSDATWRTTDYSVACSERDTVAIKTNGTLWAIGSRYSTLQSAPFPSASRSSPVQIPGTTWSKISAGKGGSFMGTKTDGTAWTWGYNILGNLGLNDPSTTYSPTQLPGTNWGTHIHMGYGNAAAVKTDGTLWVWGDDRYGNLGISGDQGAPTGYTGVQRSSPTQIPGTTWLKTAHYSYETTWALKTDGTLWSWGRWVRGSLGLAGPAHTPSDPRSSPVQIGTDTDWIDIGGAYYGVNTLKSGL